MNLTNYFIRKSKWSSILALVWAIGCGPVIYGADITAPDPNTEVISRKTTVTKRVGDKVISSQTWIETPTAGIPVPADRTSPPITRTEDPRRFKLFGHRDTTSEKVSNATEPAPVIRKEFKGKGATLILEDAYVETTSAPPPPVRLSPSKVVIESESPSKRVIQGATEAPARVTQIKTAKTPVQSVSSKPQEIASQRPMSSLPVEAPVKTVLEPPASASVRVPTGPPIVISESTPPAPLTKSTGAVSVLREAEGNLPAKGDSATTTTLAPLPGKSAATPQLARVKEEPVSIQKIPLPKNKESIPFATRTENPARVKSPYPPHHELDVAGLSRGSLAKDPRSGEVFRVP